VTLTAIPGILVGHATDRKGATGCTAILCAEGMVVGVDVGGWAAGARELEACAPHHLSERIHALVLAGGSAYGLDAAGGVMRHLESRGIGFDTGAARVPIVPAAILYDLGIGDPRARPDAAMGMRACRAANDHPVRSGCVGAGTGATIGKLFGMTGAVKSGLGNAGLRFPAAAGGATVAALAAVNAFGDVRHHETGALVAGARLPGSGVRFADTDAQMRRGTMRRAFGAPNTTLAVVATDARLSRADAARVARMCQDGLARCVSPAHTRLDGDIVFVLSAGRRRADPDCLASLACRAIGMAVLDAILSATTLAGVPSLRELRRAASPLPEPG
jgi:L-aminopeptidase/D-esterase-like protein